MSIGIIAALLLALGFVAAVGFFVLKRMVKWAVRLALLFVAVVLILAGAAAWGWYAWTDEPAPTPRSRNTSARPSNRAR